MVCSECISGDVAAIDRRPAMSYREYLQKYYGDRVHRSSRGDASDADNEAAYLSDGCVNYDADHR